MSARKVRVDVNGRGDRDVEPSDQDSRVSCETLEEAERVAHICVAYQQPCELGATCVAYQRALTDANAEPAAQAPRLVTFAAGRPSGARCASWAAAHHGAAHLVSGSIARSCAGGSAVLERSMPTERR